MGNSLLQPIAIITTVQPYLLLWLLAITFFVTMAVVALLSKGRRWYEVGCMFLLSYVLLASIALFSTTHIMHTNVMEVEVVGWPPAH